MRANEATKVEGKNLRRESIRRQLRAEDSERRAKLGADRDAYIARLAEAIRRGPDAVRAIDEPFRASN